MSLTATRPYGSARFLTDLYKLHRYALSGRLLRRFLRQIAPDYSPATKKTVGVLGTESIHHDMLTSRAVFVTNKGPTVRKYLFITVLITTLFMNQDAVEIYFFKNAATTGLIPEKDIVVTVC